jgi:hypothetical protein
MQTSSTVYFDGMRYEEDVASSSVQIKRADSESLTNSAGKLPFVRVIDRPRHTERQRATEESRQELGGRSHSIGGARERNV